MNTYRHVGRFLEAFGIHCSELKSFWGAEGNGSRECESDVLAVALPPTGPVVNFIQVSLILLISTSRSIFQVKTNESKRPWDQNPEDQKVDGKNYKDGKEQLLRDALRFLELFP